ncbi:site-2 protease family protein [Microvirga aerophila]|uniref:site-2 protease family protein n=3 Tax=Microvirga aerophila TaxID=670291 RepID=UPI001AECCDA0|nr:site-2 protease family protein [Microvirga aerophila]
MDFPSTIYSASTWIIPILIAITFHEAAHAYAAWKLGDDTAHRLGRVTFNPLKHVDLFGTILVPALLFLTKAPFLFGWAKPVPVAFGRLGHPRRDMAIVAIAGPLTNLTLAFISAALFRTVPLLPEAIAPWLVKTLYQSILLNLILAIFNMFPLPPLYGGRVALSILPKALARQYSKLERFAFVILLGIIFLLPMLGRQIGTDLNLFRWAVGIPLRWLTPFFLAVAGVAQ